MIYFSVEFEEENQTGNFCGGVAIFLEIHSDAGRHPRIFIFCIIVFFYAPR